MAFPAHKPDAAVRLHRRAKLLSAALEKRQRTTEPDQVTTPTSGTTSHRRTSASSHTHAPTVARDRMASASSTPASAVAPASSAARVVPASSDRTGTTSSTSSRRAIPAASSTGARAVSSSPHSVSSVPASSASSDASRNGSGISMSTAVGVSVIGALVVLGGAFFAWRYLKARRARAASDGFGGYVRRTSEDYVSTTGGSLRKNGDHYSFGNMAPLSAEGDKMEMQETGLGRPSYTAGMAKDSWDSAQRQPVSGDRLYPGSAGDGAEGVFAAQQHSVLNAGYPPSPHSPHPQVAPLINDNASSPAASSTDAPPQPYSDGTPAPPADPRSSANAPYYTVPGGHLSSYYDSDSGQAAFAVPPVSTMPQSNGRYAGGQAQGLSFGNPSTEGGAHGAAAMGEPQQQEVLAMPQPQSDSQQYPPQGQGPQAMGIKGAILTGLAVTSDGEEDDSPFGDPAEQGKIFVVKRTFEPSMDDELVITPGDRIEVLMVYDDGWCLGVSLDSPPDRVNGRQARGVFPRDCVEELGGATGLTRVPTLPPLDLGDEDLGASRRASVAAGGGPTVRVFGPAAGGRTSVLDEDHHEVLDQFPPPANSPTAAAYGATGVGGGSWSTLPLPAPGAAVGGPPTLVVGTTVGKRVSSLIASRDAELFLALGQALDDRAVSR